MNHQRAIGFTPNNQADPSTSHLYISVHNLLCEGNYLVALFDIFTILGDCKVVAVEYNIVL